MGDPARTGVSYPETYHLTQTDSGTELRITMGEATDEIGTRIPESEHDSITFLTQFWEDSFKELDAQLNASL